MSVLPTRRFDVVKTENYDWFLGRNFILFFNHWKATKVKILQFSSDGILYVQNVLLGKLKNKTEYQLHKTIFFARTSP